MLFVTKCDKNKFDKLRNIEMTRVENVYRREISNCI